MSIEVLEGGCHCGAVRFHVRTPSRALLDCNCSICRRKGFLHLIVPAGAFTLLHGDEQLVTYTFGTHVAKHRFCRVCGISPFYVPRSHPEGISVNARCLDVVVEGGLEGWAVAPFDGRNWEKHVESIR
ncbi:MAG: GFA family protein [Myxococcota bacterium]